MKKAVSFGTLGRAVATPIAMADFPFRCHRRVKINEIVT
jgi:hypothetical protein